MLTEQVVGLPRLRQDDAGDLRRELHQAIASRLTTMALAVHVNNDLYRCVAGAPFPATFNARSRYCMTMGVMFNESS
ncbi:hypothetical protein K239x_18680 [Planctomycetes bacterium K23_9]|uniref:Uncharacterized protein n=1 Tax=Stieleria marina TaxID=1930275 RepID=A0A517NS33_9BACT|nr:hypothetical protein K239x_18680 [Planctomycetes bacterium K23_9]